MYVVMFHQDNDVGGTELMFEWSFTLISVNFSLFLTGQHFGDADLLHSLSYELHLRLV